jgi:hypothetical protein
MPDPADMTNEEALQILREAEKAHELHTDPIPTQRQRLMMAIPLLASFVVFGVIRVTLYIREWYIDMDLWEGIGLLTRAYVDTAVIVTKWPWIFTGGMLVAGWLYFTFIARKRAGALCFNRLYVLIVFLIMMLAPVALALPLITTWETIGK